MLCKAAKQCNMSCSGSQICNTMDCNSTYCNFIVHGNESPIKWSQASNIKCGGDVKSCNLVSKLSISNLTCNASSCTVQCDDYSECSVLVVRNSSRFLKNCGYKSFKSDQCDCSGEKSCIQESSYGEKLHTAYQLSLKCSARKYCRQTAYSNTGQIEATSAVAVQVIFAVLFHSSE